MKNQITIIALIIISLSGFSQSIDQLGFYPYNGIMGLSSIDNFMILSNGQIVDNSTPSNPTLVSQYSFNGDGITVLIEDGFSYFGTGMTNDLFIADISNINFPLHQSWIDFTIGHGVFGMDIIDNTLFVALGNNGLICSIDVTDKSNPIMLDTLYISGGSCRDIVVENDFAFASHSGGLKIIDISNPSDMQLITSTGSGYNSIDIGDNLVFLGKSSGGIDVFDITDPTNPVPEFSIANSTGTAWDIKYSDNLIYLATNSFGLFIYEIQGNTGVEMASFYAQSQTFGVCLQDTLVLLPNLVTGVSLLRYNSSGTVSIKPVPNKNQIKIYPNPAKEFITIKKGDLDIKLFEIYDLKGELVLKQYKDVNERKIDISGLANGQYFIRFKTNNGVITEIFNKTE